MKKKTVLLFFILVILSGCSISKTEASISETLIEEASVILWKSIKLPLLENWVINGSVIYLNKKPVLHVEQFVGFDEKQLRENFGYESTEECMIHYIPHGVSVEEIVKKEIGNFIIYEMHCNEVDRYFKETEDFISVKEEIYIDFIIQSEEEEVYRFCFMNDMAENEKIEEYLNKISWYQEDHNTDGRYRWLMQLY